MVVNIVTIHPRVTWSRPNGEWGVDGVDLTTLPPRAYMGLLRLKDIEDELEQLRPEAQRQVVK